MTYVGHIGKKFPNVMVDVSKCPVPFLCKKCLQACPEAVFSVSHNAAREEKLKELDPRIDGNYVLGVARRDKCTVCNRCIDICPVDAIKIDYAVPKRDKQSASKG